MLIERVGEALFILIIDQTNLTAQLIVFGELWSVLYCVDPLIICIYMGERTDGLKQGLASVLMTRQVSVLSVVEVRPGAFLQRLPSRLGATTSLAAVGGLVGLTVIIQPSRVHLPLPQLARSPAASPSVDNNVRNRPHQLPRLSVADRSEDVTFFSGSGARPCGPSKTAGPCSSLSPTGALLVAPADRVGV